MNIINRTISEHIDAVNSLINIEDSINAFAERAIAALKEGKKLLLMGNGGSAADCQHIASELVGRFQRERRGLPAIALTTDTSILTSVSNDYSFEAVFARQIEALADKGDIVVGISTSGESRNIVKAVESAKESGCFTVGLLGRGGGVLKGIVDLPIVVSSDNTARVQECHLLIIHMVCEMIEEEF
jgi:D-sedoheptulose 7-phosphate isomerase